MMDRKRFLQMAVLTVALGLSVTLLSGIWKARTQNEYASAPAGETTGAEMKLTDMEYTEMQEGRRVWTLKASEAEYFQEDQKTALTSVRLTFFLEDGEEIHLESPKGILYAGTKDIELSDAVRAVLPRGYELTTRRASYRHGQQTISSDSPILISGPDMQMKGEHWKFIIPERRALLEGRVQADLPLLHELKTQSSQ